MPETETPWMTIVGEVDDVKLGSPDGETAPQVYQPVTQTVATEGVFAAAGELSGTEGWIVLRTRVAPEQMENSLRAMMQSLDPQLPLYQMQTMEHAISGSEAPRRFNTVLISSFAIVAVLLSVVGIYSVIAFTVALREQEMALRMALGCQRSGVLTLILTWCCWLCLRLVWSSGHIPSVTFFSVWGQPIRSGCAYTCSRRHAAVGPPSFCSTSQTRIQYRSHSGLARRIGKYRSTLGQPLA
jgi:hypothetical protein